jgi:hypothetical protein
MVHGHDEKRKWRARPWVELLEDRIVPSGVSTIGTHAAAAAAAHVSAHPGQGAGARFDTTVNRFDTQAATQFGRASRQIDRVEAKDRAAARTAAVPHPGSTSAIATGFGQFVTRSELRWNGTAQTLDNRFDQALQRAVTRDPALEPAAMATETSFATTNAELGSRLAGELAAASTDLQAAIGSAQATAATRVGAPRASMSRAAAAALQAAVSRVHPASVTPRTSRARPAVRNGTPPATTTPFLAAGPLTGTQFGTTGASVVGPGLGPVMTTAGVSGGAANGAFGVGTVGGTGALLGGTQPSPVTGTTGAGVDTGLDTFGIGTGFGAGTGIDMTPNGDQLFF